MYVAEKTEEKTVVGDDATEKREEKTIPGGDVAEKREEKIVLGDDVSEKREEKTNLGNDVRKVTNFFDLKSKSSKITNFPPAVKTPHLSWSGWILCVSDDSVDVNLTHFIWRIKIELPDLDTFPAYGEKTDPVIKKMVLSGSPTVKTDLVVMVIWGDKNQLAFCRSEDASWTVMVLWDYSFNDIIYRNRKLYAVDSSLRIVECDIHGPNPTQILQVFSLPDIYYVSSAGFMHYLVESSGKFLIVSRQSIEHRTSCFRIFEIDLMDGSHNEIHRVGKRALFSGCNSSVCLELPAWSKVKPNHIYFTDNIGKFNFSDRGVYNLSNRSIKDFFVGSSSIFPPPTWVVPSF